MRSFPIPACDRADRSDTQINSGSRVLIVRNTDAQDYVNYRAALERDGFVQREYVGLAHRSYAAYEKDGLGVFVNRFANTGELQVAAEENSAYFSYADRCGPACTTPRVTQVKLHDYGLSDVIRLSDDLEHYPKLAGTNAGFARWSGQPATKSEVTRRFVEKVAETGVPVYTPRTGQCYTVGDAKFCFMATLDDTVHVSDNINAASLMFMMELGGQRVFFGGDGSFGDARLAPHYGRS